MIDYAFVLGEYTVPAAEAIVFHTSIRSATEQDHVATLIGCPAGTTVEQLITGEVDYTRPARILWTAHLRPGQEAVDMILMGLEPGTYYLICDVATPAGHAHLALAMVARSRSRSRETPPTVPMPRSVEKMVGDPEGVEADGLSLLGQSEEVGPTGRDAVDPAFLVR